MTLSYRYLHSENIFVGTQERPEIKAAGVEPQITANSFDVSFRYGFNQRFSTRVTVPVVNAKASTIHADGVRRTTGPGTQLADIRAVGTFWVFDPKTHLDGNLAIGAGVKIPTADKAATSTFFALNGPVARTADISQQPGDGAWGVILEALWYQRAFKDITAYAAGFYLLNPKNTNGVEPHQSRNPADPFFMSVPDQYSVRAGLNFPLLPEKGLYMGLGGRIDGMPVTDVFGDNDGFRRPGYSVYIDPGVTFVAGRNVFNFWVPVALSRNVQTSVFDAQRGVQTRGGVADFLILFGYTRRF